MKEFAHECDHDEVTEIAEYWERQAHEAGKCVGIPLCGDCLDAWYETNKRTMNTMTKRELLNDPNSCLNKAADNEPVFLLRAHDELADIYVRKWAEHVEEILGHANEKTLSAHEIATAMSNWPNRKLPD